MLKLTVLLGGLVAYLQIRLTSAGPLIEGSPLAIYNLTARLLGELAIVLALLLLFLAILDYGYQFWRHETQLMMTIEEVRQEQREAQRDPELKRRQRASASAVSGPREVQ